MKHISHDGEDDDQTNEYFAHHLILLFEIGHSAFAHVAGYLSHAWCALIGPHHTLKENPCHDRSDGYDPKNVRYIFHGLKELVVCFSSKVR